MAKQNFGSVGSSWYVARLQNGSGGSIQAGMNGDPYRGGTGFGTGAALMSYPNPRNGGAYLSPIFLHSTGDLIGRLPGTWEICHNKPFAHLDTFNGVGAYAGKSFVAINLMNSGIVAGQIAVETSDTWS